MSDFYARTNAFKMVITELEVLGELSKQVRDDLHLLVRQLEEAAEEWSEESYSEGWDSASEPPYTVFYMDYGSEDLYVRVLRYRYYALRQIVLPQDRSRAYRTDLRAVYGTRGRRR